MMADVLDPLYFGNDNVESDIVLGGLPRKGLLGTNSYRRAARDGRSP